MIRKPTTPQTPYNKKRKTVTDRRSSAAAECPSQFDDAVKKLRRYSILQNDAPVTRIKSIEFAKNRFVWVYGPAQEVNVKIGDYSRNNQSRLSGVVLSPCQWAELPATAALLVEGGQSGDPIDIGGGMKVTVDRINALVEIHDDEPATHPAILPASTFSFPEWTALLGYVEEVNELFAEPMKTA